MGDVEERSRHTGPVLVAAVLMVAVAGGAAAVSSLGRSRGGPGPVPAEHTSPPAAGHVDVPVLVAYPEDRARQRARAWGLAAEVVRRPMACRPVGAVADQDPRAGSKVAAGSTVTITVVGDAAAADVDCPRGVAFDDDLRVAELLHDFSRGTQDRLPPVAPQVLLALDGAEPTVTLSERQAGDLDRWRVVPPSGTRADAVPVLAALTRAGVGYRVDVGPHPACAGPDRPPARAFAGLRQLSITPTAVRGSCLDWWALDVFVNEVGQVAGVNLARWEQ